MKICFLTDDPTKIGGGPEHIRQVARLLREKYHHTVKVVTPKTMNANFNFGSFLQRVQYAFWILKFLFTTNYDLYHSHTYSTAFFLPLVKLRGKKAGITVHGLGENLIGGGLVNKTGLLKGLSKLILKYWPFDFRLSASDLPGFITVGNGVNIGEFSKIKRKPHKVFTILCISRRDPVKGVDILEAAVKNLPNVKLNLVSGRQRTMADFESSDCYVLPSLSEGLPIVLLEAMAAKLPIIATDVGNCRQIVEKSHCGLIIPPGDINALSIAIQKMQSFKNRPELGENGHQFTKKYFTWEKVADTTQLSYLTPH